MALEVDNLPNGYRLGAGVRVTSGQAAGRQLYCISGVGDVLLCDGEGDASNLRVTGVLPGDEVHVDNHAFLAYCYSYRQHLLGLSEAHRGAPGLTDVGPPHSRRIAVATSGDRLQGQRRAGPRPRSRIKDIPAAMEPAGTNFEYKDGKITLPPSAAERGGIQPVVRVRANGNARTEVRVAEPVKLEVHAEVPPAAGTIVSVVRDLDGSGTYPFRPDGIDGTATEVKLSMTHAYDRPDTYFATALVHSHRDGDVHATSRRIPNLAQARVVVT